MRHDRHGTRWKHPVRRLITRVLLILVLLLGYLHVFGFPDWLLAHVLKRARTGSYSFDARRMRLDVLRGLAFSDVTVYRKRIIGPPCIEAERVTVAVAPLDWMLGRNGLRRVGIHNGIFRPETVSDPDSVHRRADFNIDLRVDLKDVHMQGVMAEHLSTRISGEGSVLRFRDVKGVLRDDAQSGAVSGSCSYDSETTVLEGEVEVAADPHILLPVFRATGMAFASTLVRRFQFDPEHAPRATLQFSRRSQPSREFAINGRVWLEDGTYRDVPFLRADCGIEASHSATNTRIRIEPLIVVRKEGVARGGLDVQPRQHRLDFHVNSSVSPQALAGMIGIFTNGLLPRCVFEGPVSIAGQGAVDWAVRDETRVELSVRGQRFQLPPLMVDEGSCLVVVDGRTVTVSDIDGRAYGGSFKGTARFEVPPVVGENVRYEMSAQVRNAEFGDIMNAVRADDEERDYSGRVTGHLRMEGLIGEGMGKTAKGKGSVSIKEGKVLMLPVFGGLSRMMARVIPGLNFIISQTYASADVTIADGAISSEKIQIEGDVLSVSGSGTYHLDRRLDFDWQLTLMRQHTLVARLVRVLTYPISKLFEFHLSGDVQNPRWRPINFSGELLQRIGLIGSGDPEPKSDAPKSTTDDDRDEDDE